MPVSQNAKTADKNRLSLISLEDVIDTAERWQSRAAQALVEIRDRRLFHPQHRSFDEYVRERWGWERSRAYQLCQFGELLNGLSTKVDSPPERESHARPLYALEPEARVAVWKEVLAKTNGRPTAREVERCASRRRAPLNRLVSGLMPYCGSKASMANAIISNMPKHRLFVETHAGSAAVLLAKSPSTIEVLNDRDDALVNLFRVLREQPTDFLRLLRRTPYSLTEWRECKAEASALDPIERARRFYVSICQSYAGFGERYNRSINKPHAKYWRDRVERLDEIVERLRSVTIENLDAIDVIKKYDTPNTLFFIDPPYVQASRSDGGPSYRVEMSDEAHCRLLDHLQGIKGRALITGGDSPLYSAKLKRWRVCYRHRLPCGTGGSKVGRYATPYRTEHMWANFAL